MVSLRVRLKYFFCSTRLLWTGHPQRFLFLFSLPHLCFNSINFIFPEPLGTQTTLGVKLSTSGSNIFNYQLSSGKQPLGWTFLGTSSHSRDSGRALAPWFCGWCNAATCWLLGQSARGMCLLAGRNVSNLVDREAVLPRQGPPNWEGKVCLCEDRPVLKKVIFNK